MQKFIFRILKKVIPEFTIYVIKHGYGTGKNLGGKSGGDSVPGAQYTVLQFLPMRNSEYNQQGRTIHFS